MFAIQTHVPFIDSTKIRRANIKRIIPSDDSKYQPFGLSKSNFKTLSSIGHEKAVDGNLKHVCEL